MEKEVVAAIGQSGSHQRSPHVVLTLGPLPLSR